MANNRYNKQVTPKGYMKGGRVKKMGGGMMKRTMLKKGSKFPDLNKDGKVTKADILHSFFKLSRLFNIRRYFRLVCFLFKS